MTVLSKERVGRVTGSRVAAILGLSPYEKRDGVLRDMVRQAHGLESEFGGNIATQWGNDHEDDAIAEYEETRGVMVHGGQTFHVHPEYDWLGVTVDGLVGNDGLLEVKAPYRATYTTIVERPDYQAQVQLQLACTRRDWADFAVWTHAGFNVTREQRDRGWLPSVLPALQDFMAEYEHAVSSPEAAEPFLAPLVEERQDPEWVVASLTFLDAQAAAAHAKRLADEARQTLVDLADGASCRGAGVRVSQGFRKGSVDYGRLLKDHAPDVDVEEYRKAGTPYQTVAAL